MTAPLLALICVLVAGFFLRAPIGFSMIVSGVAYLIVKGQDLGMASEQILNGLYNSYVLLAVPMFILAANLMNAGTVSDRLFEFCRILVGRLPGGLAQVDVLVSVIFSGMSGSAIADAAGPGLVSIKQMLKKPEYTPGFAGAIVVASATIGPIIPPSIPLVIYGLVSGASVGALFLAGVVPGLLMAVVLMIAVHLIATKRKMPREDWIPLSQWPEILYRGALPLSLPIVLLTGIYTGAFTPTEAAAVAALHAFILACVVYRALTWRTFFDVILESARGSSVITMIIAGSFVMNYAFTAEGVPQLLADWVLGMNFSKLQFLLMVNILFLILGCFMDVSVLLLVFVPILMPIAVALHVDLVHFGVVVVLNMMIGLIHPPFGMLLFVTNALTGIPIKDMMVEGWMFLVGLLMLLLAITTIPEIVLWLPQTMGYVTQ
jgi:tripartite ATP-independent transporter DctM subunit